MWLVYALCLTGILAYVANIILLYFISNYSRKDLGTYKILMLLFAAFNLVYPTVHMISMPVGGYFF